MTSIRTLFQLLTVLGAAAVLALVHGLVVGEPQDPAVDDPSAVIVSKALMLEQVLWVDARSTAAYEAAHFPGAIHLDEDSWSEGVGRLVEAWDPGQSVVVYCDGAACTSSRKVAERLREEVGMEPVYWLIDGWPALKEGMKAP